MSAKAGARNCHWSLSLPQGKTMDDNVGVPRTSEGLSVVSSLSEVSEQIAIAEHIPTEHETAATAVFHTGEEASSGNVGGHPQCEVQVVKVSNGNVSISFATPAAAASHIAASQSTLQPIQEVIADSPSHAFNEVFQSEFARFASRNDDSTSRARGNVRRKSTPKSPWGEALNAEVLIVRCRNETAELYKNKLGSGGRGNV